MSRVLPKPTGPYPVSFTDILDKPGEDAIFFRLYYPTNTFDTTRATYPQWMEHEYFEQFSVYKKGATLFSLSVPNNFPLAMPPDMEKLPILLYSHGLRLSKDCYSFVCSDLASYGYFVAAIDHKDRSAIGSFYMDKEDGVNGKYVKKSLKHHYIPFGTEEGNIEGREQVEIRVQELTRLMDLIENLNAGNLTNIFDSNSNLSQFAGKILLEKAAVIGHSLGGASAIAATATDDRFKVAVTQDPWVVALKDGYLKCKIDKPIIFINCVGSLSNDEVVKMRLLDGDVTGTTAERAMVTLLGTTHYTQSDLAFFSEAFLRSLNFVADNDPELSNAINMKLVLGFLAKYFGFSGNNDVPAIVEQNKEYAVVGTDLDVSNAEIFEAKKKLMCAFL